MRNTNSAPPSEPEVSERDLPAVAYIRVASGSPADQQTGAQWQRHVISAAAQRLGITITREFTDPGQPGITLDRPGLQAMLAYITDHQVGYCIVASLDRLSRDPVQLADLDEQLTAAEVVMVDASHWGQAR